MTEQTIKITPEFVIEVILRRRWLLILPLFIAGLAGIYLSITLPRVYEAKTLILVEPQRVPQTFVRPIVTEESTERINTLSQQILSRTNLERIIKEFNLFATPESIKMFMEDKVAGIQKRIKIETTMDRRRETDAFSIAYRDDHPQRAMRVANALATYFIDENLKVREAQASGTSQFLDAELETMRGRLEELESAIKDYRKTYMGELPEQLETNLRVLDRLQENLTDRQEASRAARNRLADLNNQASSRPAPVVVINGDQRTTPTRSLTEMRAELENLKSRYTEQHPDIIRLQKQISEQEAQLKDQKEDNDNSQSTVRIPPELRRQFRDVQEEIHTVDNEIQQIKRQIAEHQQRIENTPKREQELLGLRRDYQNIQTTYDSLLNRKLEADIAVNMERKQKGEQFKIIDPARIPERPVEPDMRKLFAITVFIGLALGAAGAFLPEYVSATYRKADEIESAFGLPVLAEIPSLISPRKMKLTRINNLFSVTGSVVTFSLIGVFGLICLTGSERISSLLRNIFIH